MIIIAIVNQLWLLGMGMCGDSYDVTKGGHDTQRFGVGILNGVDVLVHRLQIH